MRDTTLELRCLLTRRDAHLTAIGEEDDAVQSRCKRTGRTCLHISRMRERNVGMQHGRAL